MEFTATPITGTSSIHGEGALWDGRSKKLLWVDIDGGKVNRYDPATGESESWSMGTSCGTVVRRARGADEVAVALGDGLATVDLTTGAITYLQKIDLTDSRFNDGKCDRAGRFWAGTMFKKGVKGTAVLYRVDADHSLHTMLTGLSISNGLVWTRDKKTMHFIDTPTATVDVIDYDDATGAIANRRPAVKIDGKLGHPDGMAIDAEDRIWIAMWGGSQVCCFDPVSAKLLHTVHCPGSLNTSSCSFGGPGLTDLFITTSTQGIPPEKRAAFPNSGQLYHCELPFAGVPADEYAG